MEITIIFAILIIHWIADFVLQTDSQAKGKSKNWNDLLSHTFSYSVVWFILGFVLLLYNFNLEQKEFAVFGLNVILFTLITFTAHTATDYFTSRLNSRLWEQGRTHDFFVAIGFDQVLHYVQLILTYLLIFG